MYDPADARKPYVDRERGTLGDRLTRVRLKVGLTQEQLAKLLGVGVASVRRWERGTAEPRGLSRREVDRFLKGELR